ncbi:uncharacterized protein LOC127281798 [Leptopilina boulardi]|uniref:uncharacterized protein LOC127281798 n=1 Tax=Leptopilina boulardi TaxID=63433 RepID=UPI0021F662E2|nr:uncharacterized protein LOC127281798 [Leptopilina boulardi]
MFSRNKNKKEEISKEEIKQLLVFSATRYQQDFYELLSDFNEYDPQKSYILKNCIGIILYGPPKAEENQNYEDGDSLFQYKPMQMKKIDRLFLKIAEHGTQENKMILCGLIYNVIFDDKAIKLVNEIIHKEEDFNGDCLVKYVNPIPVFKVLKTTIIKNDETKVNGIKMEIYYIDTNERVYKNWEGYLTNNVLPRCIMVVPYNGEYQGDESEQWTEEMSYIRLEIHESPACRNKIFTKLDASSTVISLGGMAVCAASLVTPVGAIALAASSVGLGVSSLWTIGRSTQTLVDRSKHQQSINILNREGFSCWFNIGSSAFGVASAGGSILLTRAIAKGSSISRTFQLVHDGVQIGNLTATGINAGISIFNIYDTYKESKTVSKQDVFNLIATLLVLGNSVMNYKCSKTLIENHQNSIIKNYEASLRSNRHKKAFKKMVNNTKSIIENPVELKEQIIRGINKIENKDEFFASIIRNKKNFSSEGIKPAFIDGNIVINGKTFKNPIDFVKSFSMTDSNTSLAMRTPIVTTNITIPNKSIFENALTDFIARHTKELAALATPKIKDFFYVLTDISKIDKADVIFTKLLIISIKLVKALIEEKNPVSNILARAVDFLWNYIKTCIKESLEELVSESQQFREILMKVLINLYSSVEEKLDEWIFSFKEYLKKKCEQFEDGVYEYCSNQFERINIASSSLLSNGTIS